MARGRSYKEHLHNRLQDSVEAAGYLNAALEDEDPHVFLLALKDVVEAKGGMSWLSEESSMNRQSLYRSLSERGNPKMKTILSILSSLGMEIEIRPGGQAVG